MKLNSPLSNSIYKEHQNLIKIINKFPLHNRTKKIIFWTNGMASIADIIAYQIGWGTLLISWYEAGIKGKMPEMPGDGFTKWDYKAIAYHFYKKYHFDNGQQQEKKFYEVVDEILQITEFEYQTENLDKVGVWNWCKISSGKQWPLSKWIQVNTIAPYKRASAAIKRSLKIDNN